MRGEKAGGVGPSSEAGQECGDCRQRGRRESMRVREHVCVGGPLYTTVG